MILLPYIHKTSVVNNMSVHTFTILTVGGKELWEDDIKDASVKEILEQNDIFTESIEKVDDIYLCKVAQKTKLTDFYKWNEITDSSTFCWRTLYTFGDNHDWLPHPTEYMSGYLYKDICNMVSNTSK